MKPTTAIPHPTATGDKPAVPPAVAEPASVKPLSHFNRLVSVKQWTLAIVIIACCISALAKPPNILLLCIDDLRPELRAFGAQYVSSPNIDALAARGRAFTRHYVQAPTCGASRYTLLTGRYGPSGNDGLFRRARRLANDDSAVPPSMPAWFRSHGYSTVAVGKVSHHPGGRGGANWDAEDEWEMPRSWDESTMPCGAWQHPRGAVHGLANGEIRHDASDMAVYQAKRGGDVRYPDDLITEEAIAQLGQLAQDHSDTSFLLAVGLIKPHLPFGAPAEYYEQYEKMELPAIPHPAKPAGRTTWHASREFRAYNRWGRDPRTDPAFAELVRKHYAACVSYADSNVGRILARLDELGIAQDTVVVLWGDHGWHLGEHGIWGKHSLFEESLRSPLVIAYPGIADPGVASNSIVSTVDLFPTLCKLAGVPKPDFVDGVALQPILASPTSEGRPAISYWKSARTIRTPDHRLVVHRDGYVELYDHATQEGETRNIATDQPGIVTELREALNRRLPRIPEF